MGMEQYMGYRAPVKSKENEEGRELPVFNIGGTDFIIDLKKHEFRQSDNPYNRITLGNVKEEMGFSHFLYDNRTKNIYLGDDRTGVALPMHVSIILVPPLKDLDPVGLARRHGLPDEFYGGKSVAKQKRLTEFTKQDRKVETTIKSNHGKKKRRGKRKGV